MTLIFIKYKNGNAESHEIEKFVIEGSTIRVETKDDIFFLDYADIENIEVINP